MSRNFLASRRDGIVNTFYTIGDFTLMVSGRTRACFLSGPQGGQFISRKEASKILRSNRH